MTQSTIRYTAGKRGKRNDITRSHAKALFYSLRVIDCQRTRGARHFRFATGDVLTIATTHTGR